MRVITKDLNSAFVNDTYIAIPFSDYEEQRNIVSNLYEKKSRGYIIREIEVDDLRRCVSYHEPNKQYN